MTASVVPWGAERVIELAPDAASAKAGRAQASASKWSGLGASPDAVWGACKGSGQKPYQACVELDEPAFRCSCPSRKFPCKHALGLLLLWAAGEVHEGPPPEWVGGWLDGRAAKAQRAEKRAAPSTPRSTEASAKRAGDRAERVAGGAAELREWLTDRARSGFGGLSVGGADELRTVAARMVDAQAPGLAGGLRRAAGLVGRGRDWPGALLSELSLLYVLAEACTRLGELPTELAETVRTRLGFTVDSAKVLEHGDRVADLWLVCGVADEEHDRLITRRTWLRGKHTGRFALVLSFAPQGRPLDGSLPSGHVVPGELAYYPGSSPLRAMVAERGEPVPAPCPDGDSVAASLGAHARALAADPWLDRWPMLLSRVIPARYENGFALSDVEGSALPLVPAADHWPLLALSAGAPITVAAEWTTSGLRPLACWHEDRAVRL
ncbi:SWIM zinc finger family protein [Amycolatopsis sp. H20-H5]|uniref:SWIM zinc finger family protein n=1 Tax=Amycolatopsis sp. H20-H5 TaxID=3046309 RepID=UPI002DB5EF7B|nr:SWIM zinc finger family protein [Amycolatopsis sp. H20-H5]MEC3974834.1 SWIM zinc finger family protein [Amycolatopsis sp. H20-H5]